MTPINSEYSKCDFGDKRLNHRAIKIAAALSNRYGQPLSQVFTNASDLKRTYEFFTNSKTSFETVIEPAHLTCAELIAPMSVVLCVGDTTYLDFKTIKEKREEYGPTGNGGNGLILHSALAINPENGQPMGLLWEKLWHREHKQNQETQRPTEPKAKKKRKTRQFVEKESYRWVEAFDEVGSLFPADNAIQPRLIHVFDREGDISEVLEKATMTYLNRTNPLASASEVLSPVEIEVLKAKAKKKLPASLTVAWAMESVARLGGYLEHRQKSKIGITVLWRGWIELHILCEGWKLHQNCN
jgi:hypothetical protein